MPRNGNRPGAARGLDVDAEWQATTEADQTTSDLDQTQSDADQTASDDDQRSSEADEAASVTDQEGADTEQQASNRDQAAADRDHASATADPASQRAYDASREERAGASAGREATAATRTATALARTRDAVRRDETADLRDLSALARDRTSEARDRAAERLAAKSFESENPKIRALERSGADIRSRAAHDRANAASDRERASVDRQRAAADRRQARVDLQRAHLDDLTGVYTRSLGQVTLQHEIDRARRSGEPFVLAFVDVDGLKEVNDREGHAAGDALLQAVTAAIKSKLRSYDPIVRVGGDEFVCGFVNTGLGAARRRVRMIQTGLEQSPLTASISVGLAALGPDDTLEDLTARGDADLYEAKHSS
jgi:diguanylate cyclase (GGDEF)-like protein